MDLQEQFDIGRQYFDAGEYFEAHEAWEDMWKEENSGPRHAFLQGVIQVAVALHHAGNKNFKGTHKLLASAFNYLKKGESDSDPVDMAKLIDYILDFENAVQRGDESLPYFKLPMKP